METTENNKLIAEFTGTLKKMYKDNFGGQVYYNPADENDRHSEMYTNQFKYHTSWDWLMPVVEKIEVLGYSFEKNYQPIDKDWQCLIVKGYDILFQEFDEDSLKATYEAVVEFIKFYNKNKED